MDTLVQ